MTARDAHLERRELVARLLHERGIARSERVAGSGVTSAPMSSGQRGIWLHQALFPEGSAYNSFAAFSVEGPLDASALELAVRDLQRRHEILRTVFSDERGEPVQRVLPDALHALSVVDVAGLSDDVVAAWVRRFAAARFDLSRGPVVRVAVLAVAPRRALLLVNVHHIAIDAWSVPIFLDELSAAYRARVNGEVPSSHPPPLQFCDFALGERRSLDDGSFADDLAHWRRALSSATPFCLDADRPRREMIGERAVEVAAVTIDAGLVSTLRSFASACSATLFSVLLAPWVEVLRRSTGRSSVTVCTPTANRERPGVESLIGFFANVVPLHFERSGESFRELVAAASSRIAEALTHQAVPFDAIVDHLGLRRRLPRNPISDVLFAVHDFPLERLRLPGCRVRALPRAPQGTRFEIEVHVTTSAQGAEIVALYDRALFDAATVRALLAAYRAALLRMLAEPDTKIVTPEAPRDHGAVETSIAARIEARARTTPDRLAVISDRAQTSYASLNRKADALASVLVREGVGPESIVGVCVERSTALVIAVLAIVKAGGAYVALDPAHPPAHLRALLDVAAPTLVLASSSCIERVGPARTIDVDAMTMQGRSPRPRVPRHRDAATYVTFTSGSTGTPKGVTMTDGSLFDLLAWQERQCGVGPGARTLQFTSLAFDLSYQDLLGTLASGGTIVSIDEDHRKDPDALAEVIERHGVHRAFVATVALEQLAPAMVRRRGRAELAHVITAGEQLHATADLRAMFEALPGCALTNEYGPSETHAVTAYRLSARPGDWVDAPPIGTAIPGAGVFLLDRRMEVTSPGELGEIFVGGACVGRGYLGRAGLTAERFLPDPFSVTPGARLYRTGDLARLDLDDLLRFVRRADRRTKVNGHAVDPTAVESVLASHPCVSGAVVQAVGDRPGDRRLVAYFSTTASAACPTEGELRAWLGERLPQAFVPSSFVPLTAFPLNVNGKIDRGRLPAPPARSLALVIPDDPLEAAIVAIWGEVLERDAILPDDDFFALGGHSLLATRVVSHVEEVFGIRLPLRTMFASRTPRAMARDLVAAAPDRDALRATAADLVALALDGDDEREAG